MSFHAPKRRKAVRAGIRESSVIRSLSHLQYLRGCVCCVEKMREPCDGRMEAHHVRHGNHAGRGQKPGDDTAVPLCAYHHRKYHDTGHDTFERLYRVDLERSARDHWDKSPAGIKYRLTREKE